jgi:hypothetical protein
MLVGEEQCSVHDYKKLSKSCSSKLLAMNFKKVKISPRAVVDSSHGDVFIFLILEIEREIAPANWNAAFPSTV